MKDILEHKIVDFVIDEAGDTRGNGSQRHAAHIEIAARPRLHACSLA